MEVLDRIKAHLSSAPVVLFMKGTPDFPQCGFSAQTVAALRACGSKFNAVKIPASGADNFFPQSITITGTLR